LAFTRRCGDAVSGVWHIAIKFGGEQLIGTANRLSEFIEALGGGKLLEWTPKIDRQNVERTNARRLGQRPGAGADAPGK
jgi:hypothetical protein